MYEIFHAKKLQKYIFVCIHFIEFLYFFLSFRHFLCLHNIIYNLILLLLSDLEVKSISDHEAKRTEDHTELREKVQEAGIQIAKRYSIFKDHHKDILSSDWTYLGAVALPMVKRLPEGISPDQRLFILDQTQLNDPQYMEGWFDQVTGLAAQNKFPVDFEYDNLLTRIIGSLLISPKEIAPEARRIYNLTSKHRLPEIEKMQHEKIAGPGTAGKVLAEDPTDQEREILRTEPKKPDRSHLGSFQACVM